uniref:Uncharacterized protein n=1 Tax=Rhizophora mucronata TaxID=61149 RepID=A0A2P2K247_RHIMU
MVNRNGKISSQQLQKEVVLQKRSDQQQAVL